jgi:hypothetical protein
MANVTAYRSLMLFVFPLEIVASYARLHIVSPEELCLMWSLLSKKVRHFKSS